MPLGRRATTVGLHDQRGHPTDLKAGLTPGGNSSELALAGMEDVARGTWATAFTMRGAISVLACAASRAAARLAAARSAL